jgi:hypothetical protein
MTIIEEPPPDWRPEWPPEAADFRIPVFVDQAMRDIVEHYETKVNVPLPARRYWTTGSTAHDCEQMVLAIQQMFLGTAEVPLETTQCSGPRGLTFTVEVVRCVPTLDNRGKPPSGEAIELASIHPVIDMEIMLDLAAYFDPFLTGVIVNVDPIPAQGGYHGAIGTYSVTL